MHNVHNEIEKERKREESTRANRQAGWLASSQSSRSSRPFREKLNRKIKQVINLWMQVSAFVQELASLQKLDPNRWVDTKLQHFSSLIFFLVSFGLGWIGLVACRLFDGSRIATTKERRRNKNNCKQFSQVKRSMEAFAHAAIMLSIVLEPRC